MVNATLAIVSIIFVLVILVIVAIVTLLAASELYNSTLYQNSQVVRNAHKYITLAGLCFWSIFILLLISFLIAFFADVFSVPEIASTFLQKNTTVAQTQAYLQQQKLANGGVAATLFLGVLVVSIIGVIAGSIFAALCASELRGVSGLDAKASRALTEAIISTIGGLLALVGLIAGTVVYTEVRSFRHQQEEVLTAFVNKTGNQVVETKT